LDESITLSRELGDNWLIAKSLACRSSLAWDQHDHRLSGVLLEESVARFRQAGDRSIFVIVLSMLGHVALHLGAHERVLSLSAEALGIAQEVGYRYGIAMCLEGLARMWKAEGHAGRAARLMAAAAELRTGTSGPMPPGPWRADYERDVAATRAQLG